MVEKIEDIVARQVEAFPTYKSTRSQFGIPLEETEKAQPPTSYPV